MYVSIFPTIKLALKEKVKYTSNPNFSTAAMYFAWLNKKALNIKPSFLNLETLFVALGNNYLCSSSIVCIEVIPILFAILKKNERFKGILRKNYLIKKMV